MSADKLELEIAQLDSSSDLPLYHQIELDLRRLIREGVWQPGDVLPSEIELARLYGVGRQTMRLALARLVADDLIARQAGRGTFVQPQHGRIDFYLDRSFTRQMADLGLQARSQVLAQSVSVVDEALTAAFQPYLGEGYLHLTRLRLGDGEPVGLQSSRILLARCPSLPDHDFNRESLYAVLLAEYRLQVQQIDHRITAAVADELQAGLLHVREGEPLLVVRTQAFLADGQLIEETTSYYRADRYEYRTSHRYQPKDPK